jgi:hypothetical protein
MVGAIGLALAIEYNRNGVFTFLVPAVMGFVILLASWVGKMILPLLYYISNCILF